MPTASESDLTARHPKLLYIMEYDCKFDWEPVKLERGLTDDVVAWLLNLQDRLTVTAEQPVELMVRQSVRSGEQAVSFTASVQSCCCMVPSIQEPTHAIHSILARLCISMARSRKACS